MSEFLPAFNLTMKYEGGYANDPHDHGGETYRGISRKNWPGWDGWQQIDRIKAEVKSKVKAEAELEKTLNLKLATNADLQQRVRDFYQRNFWTPTMIEIPDQNLANWLFDKSVNMGIQRANRLLQAALGVTVDGVMGPKTMQAIRAADMSELLWLCREQARSFYVSLAEKDPTQARFLKGWLARA